MFELLHARDSIRSVIASLRWRLRPSPAEIRELVFPLPYSSLTSFKLSSLRWRLCLLQLSLIADFLLNKYHRMSFILLLLFCY
ncbi:hypothetical protein IGI04_016406 [Brassica rapa subsp. trilocularis]|uniref:F-box domain-containing protein n=1 Tax=Brassica rapa subsp. trilocularis TaxID=1813537 RepID=A0ABQ7MSX3_BRACM|nr:hypothetical protein IGI04_016406 [Brassica rapa subsp. trilocularis]